MNTSKPKPKISEEDAQVALHKVAVQLKVARDRRSEIQEAYNSLDEPYKVALVGRLKRCPDTFRSIGAQLGLSGNRITQLYRVAMHRIERALHYAGVKELSKRATKNLQPIPKAEIDLSLAVKAIPVQKPKSSVPPVHQVDDTGRPIKPKCSKPGCNRLAEECARPPYLAGHWKTDGKSNRVRIESYGKKLAAWAAANGIEVEPVQVPPPIPRIPRVKAPKRIPKVKDGLIRLSTLIKTLRSAKKQFGDVPAFLMNEETGDWHLIAQVIKLHPYTAPHGCLNRAEPVNGVAFVRSGGGASDLVLAPT